ncbi:hypothetical protein F5876DRAFT_69417 [Lentinula aff. lateritia]|uniref:Uncharacterized protein n=1 Tax=Lentinula aff. lateritia TaxID=2804960 RepID=A0ACC1TMM5_9AGAR|nr:hypothetical protein F5876DRAFT_69417 [Lentinula aff. lateritia]
MSKRRGRTSTADSGPSLEPSTLVSPTATVQTRASKRKSNILPSNNTELENVTQLPPAKRTKSKNTATTSQNGKMGTGTHITSKKGKSNTTSVRSSKSMAQGLASTITTTPAKELTQTQVSSQVQVIAQPIARKRKSDTLQTTNIGARKSVEAKENQELDIESGDEDTADIEMGDEHNDDHSAGLHLVDEAPHFMVKNGENSMDIVTGSIRRTPPSHNPSNNAEITSDNLEFDFRPLARTPAIQLPVVVDNTIATTKKPTSDIATKELQWKARTNIVLNAYTSTTRSYTLKKNLQNDDIKCVISLAIKRGALLLLTVPELKGNSEDVDEGRESSKCCLTVSGLKALTLEALIWAAEQHGFEGENDLADRLENGDPAKYINPLIKYVSSCISLERGYLKNFSATILAAFDIDHSFAGIAKAGDLLRQSNYIYPIGRNGQFEYLRPFEHEAVTRFLSEAFFSNSNFAKSVIAPNKADLFASSIPKRPLELQLPKGMLVMAGCIIHSVLADVGKSKKDDFPPFGLETQWQTFLDILNSLEDSSKLNYHIHSVGLAAHGLTHNEVLNRIDFEAFAQATPTGDDSDNGNDGDGGDSGDDGDDGGDDSTSDGYGSGHDLSNTA